MVYSLTETELKELIREIVCKVVSNVPEISEETMDKVLAEKRQYLTEMAFKRKDYKEKIDNLSSQIVENWCLIRHCRLYNEMDNCKHWMDELKGHLLTVARYNIKGTDSWQDKEQAIREVWNDNDYFEPKTIEYVIHNKFRKEGFDSDSDGFLQIINDCINSFNTLLHLIAIGKISELYHYVDSLSE